MGVISSVNLLENNIGIEQAEALASILKEHPTLKSLCGNRGDETELDMSGKKLGADGAIMFAAEIISNGALSLLNLASNDIGAIVGWTHHLGYEYDGYEFMHSDGRHQKQLPGGEEIGKPEGLIAVANAIPDMGALSSVNVLSNVIPVEQAQELVKIMRSKDTLTPSVV
jgi:hypothetical protein